MPHLSVEGKINVAFAGMWKRSRAPAWSLRGNLLDRTVVIKNYPQDFYLVTFFEDFGCPIHSQKYDLIYEIKSYGAEGVGEV